MQINMAYMDKLTQRIENAAGGVVLRTYLEAAVVDEVTLVGVQAGQLPSEINDIMQDARLRAAENYSGITPVMAERAPTTGKVSIPALAIAPVNTNDNSLALLGDSITLRNQQGATAVWNNEGYFIVANMLMRQKYAIINVTGLSGYTIEQIAESGLPAVLASGAKRCFVLAGTNNATDANAQTIFDKLTTLLWKPLRDAGIHVWAATIPPNGGWTATQSAKMAAVNDMIRAAKSTWAGLRVADLWAATVDGSTGGPRSSVFGDSIHPAARGGMYFARAIAASDSGDVISTERVSGGRYDPMILSANPLAFGNNANGANGTVIGTGGTGTGPDQWDMRSSNAATTFTCSGGNARNPADYLDGRALDVAVAYGGDDHYFQASVVNGADIYLDRAWTSTTAKIAGTLVKPVAGRTGGFQYKCLVSGTTGSVEPTWPTVLGATVTDGTCTWMAVKDVVAGDIYQLDAEIVFSALSGYVCPALRIAFDTSNYSGVLRPLLIANGVAVASVDTNPVSPVFNTGTAAWDYVPLNSPIMVRSQQIVIPSQAEVSHISPQFRLYGKSGTTASFKIQRLEFRRVG